MMNNEKVIKLEWNPVFKSFNKSTERINVLFGGAGSGKSHHVFRHEFLCMLSIPGYNVLGLRKVATTISTSIFPLLRKFVFQYDLGDRVKVNKSEHYIECIENGNVFLTGGMNSEEEREKIKSITCKSGNLASIIMEEATQFDKEDYLQCDLRLRGDDKLKKKLIMLFNPINIDHWIRREFDIQAVNGRAISGNKKAFVLKTTYGDNQFIDDEYKERLELLKETDPYFYQVYAKGEWGILSENNVIIPYPIIWKAFENKVDALGQFDMGIDAAGFGDNKAEIRIKRGMKWLDKMSFDKSDGNDLADGAQFLIDKHRGVNESVKVFVKVDETGEGSSCRDALRARKLPNVFVIGVNFGQNAKNKDKYANAAAEMYFEARDQIPEMELLKDDELCYTELSRRTYGYDNNRRYKVKQKELEKKDTGLGFDCSDAFCLACYAAPEIAGIDSEPTAIVQKKDKLDELFKGGNNAGKRKGSNRRNKIFTG